MKTMQIEHDTERHRFHATIDGQRAVCDYSRIGQSMVMTHTEVPYALRGHGVASALVAEAVAYARANGLKIRPLCSYVRSWLRRHPEESDLCERA